MKWKGLQSCGLHVRGYPDTHQQRPAYLKQPPCGKERQDDCIERVEDVSNLWICYPPGARENHIPPDYVVTS